jgi:hypothetical protein
VKDDNIIGHSPSRVTRHNIEDDWNTPHPGYHRKYDSTSAERQLLTAGNELENDEQQQVSMAVVKYCRLLVIWSLRRYRAVLLVCVYSSLRVCVLCAHPFRTPLYTVFTALCPVQVCTHVHSCRTAVSKGRKPLLIAHHQRPAVDAVNSSRTIVRITEGVACRPYRH